MHCYYERRLAGPPVAGRRLQIRLRARRFTCENTASRIGRSPSRYRR
ncbi:hypothetical protein E5671_02650 [Streptomyces sp. BA2]|nr:hypothetical protein [Streptomyces sp. BA2]